MTLRYRHRFPISILTTLLLAGCATRRIPDLSGLYGEAARQQSTLGNPVILIPGVMGSTLVDKDTGSVVWGVFRGGSISVSSPAGARQIALPMAENVPLPALRDGVEPTGVLDRLRFSLLRVPIALKVYSNILRTLGIAGYQDESLGRSGVIDYGSKHYTCFQFDYDWRRSNAENAARLDAFILRKRAYVQEEKARRGGRPAGDVRFDIAL